MTRPPNPSEWLLPASSTAWKHGRPRVLLLGGDGVGPEVVAAAAECLEAMRLDLELRWPREHAGQRPSGKELPAHIRDEIDGADAVLFGASDTAKGSATPILRYLRYGLDTYANLRPAVTLPGIPTRTGNDVTALVIVRELSEGMYPGREGSLAELRQRYPELRDRTGRPLASAEGAFAVGVVTEVASRRIAKYAVELARHRQAIGAGSGELTIVDKSNVLPLSDGLFRRICQEEAGAAGVTGHVVHTDEAARQLVASPERFDVIVTTNVYGDILSDVAAEIMGGLPLAPSGAIGASSAYFEPCHGSAPDIAGSGRVNPTATLLSAAMMLAYLHHPEKARDLAGAVTAALASGCRTADLGGTATCRDLTAEVSDRLVGSPA